jgi:hypothetical protein
MIQLFGSGFGQAWSTTNCGAWPVADVLGASRSIKRLATSALASTSAVSPPLFAGACPASGALEQAAVEVPGASATMAAAGSPEVTNFMVS